VNHLRKSRDWNNPLNPDPTVTVRWGDQTWEEMLMPFVGVLVDRDADPGKVSGNPVYPRLWNPTILAA
jgi:hypothetical protein